jgi:hypothetical protein
VRVLHLRRAVMWTAPTIDIIDEDNGDEVGEVEQETDGGTTTLLPNSAAAAAFRAAVAEARPMWILRRATRKAEGDIAVNVLRIDADGTLSIRA